jgi:hypothetical protein
LGFTWKTKQELKMISAKPARDRLRVLMATVGTLEAIDP